jgi:hypothetical protein
MLSKNKILIKTASENVINRKVKHNLVFPNLIKIFRTKGSDSIIRYEAAG